MEGEPTFVTAVTLSTHVQKPFEAIERSVTANRKRAGSGRRLVSYLSSIATVQNSDFPLSHSADHVISMY